MLKRVMMVSLGLIHCDETGCRVDGKTCWVHVASDPNYTYLTVNRKRGQTGMDAADVLPHARGVIVHDCWGSYWKYEDVTHAIIKTAWTKPLTVYRQQRIL